MIHAVNERVKTKVNSNSNFRAIPYKHTSTGGCPDILVLVVATHHCIHTKTRHFSSWQFFLHAYSRMNVGVHFLELICQIFNHQYQLTTNSPNFCPPKFLAIRYLTVLFLFFTRVAAGLTCGTDATV